MELGANELELGAKELELGTDELDGTTELLLGATLDELFVSMEETPCTTEEELPPLGTTMLDELSWAGELDGVDELMPGTVQLLLGKPLRLSKHSL